MMELNEFIETIRNELKSELGNDYSVEVEPILKNNSVMYHGLSIRKENGNLAPAIYLEPYYDIYSNRGTKEARKDIINRIIRLYNEPENLPPCINEVEKLAEYEHARDRIMFKLINTQKNKTLLEQIPNIPYLDLSIVFYLHLDENTNGRYTAMIHNSHKEIWGVSDETLYRQAMENMQKTFPACIKNLLQVIGEFVQISEITSEMENAPQIYILSNQAGMNGAGAILYENVLQEFSERNHCDLIILPSSIHETLLLLADEDTDYQELELQEMVKYINLTEVSAEDRLSDHVYRYNRSIKKLCIAV